MSTGRRTLNAGTETSGGGAATLERGLQVLSVFTRDDPKLSLSDLSERTGINKPTLLRFLKSLGDANLVVQNDARLYHVGSSALALASAYRASVTNEDLIVSALTRIARATGENASYSVLEGAFRVVAFYVPSQHRIRDHVEVGDTFPLTRGAPGRVLRAFEGDGRSARSAELEQVRTDAYAVSHGEVEAGASAVAVPVFKATKVVAALAITGPSSRLSESRIQEFVPMLLQAAMELTRQMEGDHTMIRAALRRLTAKHLVTPEQKSAEQQGVFCGNEDRKV